MAVIDPALDCEFKAERTSTRSADRLLAYVAAHALQVDWILETHTHADHLSSARSLRERVGGRIALGENIRQVQAVFKTTTTSSARSCPMAGSSTTCSKTARSS